MFNGPPNDSPTYSGEAFSPSHRPQLLMEGKPQGPIVIPVDFSLDSVEAVKQGYNLSLSIKEPIYLLHVIPEVDEKPKKTKRKTVLKKSRKQRDKAADRMAKFLRKNDIAAAFKKDGVKYHISLARGEPLAAILTTAEKVRAGIIIMGCGRNSGPSSNLLGATTERVLRLAQRPVMVVKRPLDMNKNEILGEIQT
ncbi:MAG: universal stress protein [Magnetococcales bacterium]|nr:universal stress protein [Magnetococcales bacterium]